ncbi:MAG: hypothetical protein ABSG32_32535, partial [Terriglobia bacterium]
PTLTCLITPASTPTTTLERWHVAALWTDANLPALQPHRLRCALPSRFSQMIELENASQAGLRHFVSVEWACTQERSPAIQA